MRIGVCCVAALLSAIVIVGDVVAAPVKSARATKLDATIGICVPIPNPVVMPNSAEYQLSGASMVITYFDHSEHIDLYEYLDSDTTTATVVHQPKHGKLVDDFKYYPDAGYIGEDNVTYLVDIGGKRVKLVYFLQVFGQSIGNDNYYQGVRASDEALCTNDFPRKISSNADADAESVSTVANRIPQVAAEVTGQQCFNYEPAIVELTGAVNEVLFPSPLEYARDSKENYWILTLDRPTCVAADATNQMNVAEANFVEVQLMSVDYDRYQPLLGKRVSVKGSLYHKYSPHDPYDRHHKLLLLRVTEMQRAS